MDTPFFTPFGYLLQDAEQAIEQAIGGSDLFVSDYANTVVTQQLQPELNALLERVMVYEYNAAHKNSKLEGDTVGQRQIYFLQQMAEPDNREAILKKYPVLARRLNTKLEFFIANQQKFIDRLQSDWLAITATFFSNMEQLKVCHVKSGGDKHAGGQTVFQITLRDDQKNEHQLIYKPRSLGIEVALQQFLSWTNTESDFDFYQFKLVDRQDYGWCEYVTHEYCENEQQLQQFYFELGGLLGILLLLNGHDVHYENLIAHGVHPVLVDVECILRPQYCKSEKQVEVSIEHPLLFQSMILPCQVSAGDDGGGVDISALSGHGGQLSIYRRAQAAHLDSDQPQIIREQQLLPDAANLPWQDELEFLQYEEPVVHGFMAIYDFFVAQRDRLLDTESPIKYFSKKNIRVLFRPTSFYGQLLAEGTHPKLLHSEEAWQRHLDYLIETASDLSLQQVVTSEIQALQQGDVPVFGCATDGDMIFDNAHQATNVEIQYSGIEGVKHYITATLGEKDRALQLQFIRNSFAAYAVNNNKQPAQPRGHFEFDALQDIRQQCLAYINYHLQVIERKSVVVEGRLCWPTISCNAAGTWVPGLTRYDFYEGSLGIGFVYLQAAQLLDNSDYLRMAEQIFKFYIDNPKQVVEHLESVGFYNGVGGVLWCLRHYYQATQQQAALAALDVYLQCLPELIAVDEVLDIIGGASGCLLSLVSLRGVVSEEKLMPLAQQCVEKILENYPQPGNTVQHQQVDTHKSLLGFSHGTAGIAYALAHYHFELQPDQRCLDWISAALQYEREHFSQQEQMWPRFGVSPVQDSFDVSWCHGAAGMLVSRLYFIKYLNDPLLVQEIDCAVGALLSNTDLANDSLCHGHIGSVSCLTQAARQGRLDTETANNFTLSIIGKLLSGGMLSNQGLVGQHLPGLLLGQAGAVYEILRYQSSEPCESILIP